MPKPEAENGKIDPQLESILANLEAGTTGAPVVEAKKGSPVTTGDEDDAYELDGVKYSPDQLPEYKKALTAKESKLKNWNSELTQASQLNAKTIQALAAGQRGKTSDDSDEEPKLIDLRTIDQDVEPKKYTDALMHNQNVLVKRTERAEARAQRAEASVLASGQRTTILDNAVKKAKDLNLNIPEAELKEMISELSGDEDAESFATKVVDMLAKNAKRATPTKPKDPKEGLGPRRLAPGGGGPNAEDLKTRAMAALQKAQKDGSYDSLTLIQKVKLNAAATGATEDVLAIFPEG